MRKCNKMLIQATVNKQQSPVCYVSFTWAHNQEKYCKQRQMYFDSLPRKRGKLALACSRGVIELLTTEKVKREVGC